MAKHPIVAAPPATCVELGLGVLVVFSWRSLRVHALNNSTLKSETHTSGSHGPACPAVLSAMRHGIRRNLLCRRLQQ
jgi:hypothetical protein